MHFIGLEIAAGGTRAVAIDLEGTRVISRGSAPHAWLDELPDGYREQDPVVWIEAVDHAMRECLAGLGSARADVAAIGVAGPLRGWVALDEANRIVRPSKIGGDRSARRQVEEIGRAFGGAPGLLELTGHAVGIDSFAAECLWLKHHEPAHFQQTHALLSAQDFIAYWLCGERGTEPGTASTTGLFDIRNRCWSREMLGFIDPRLYHMLPDVSPSDQIRGMLRGVLAREWGLPEHTVIGPCSAAPMLSALAAGCVMHGTVAVELGSAGTILAAGDAPVIDLGGEILALCHATGTWLGHASSPNTAAVPEVMRRHYGWSTEKFEATVSSVLPGADGLLMLPYFHGENIPKLPDGTGVLHGITHENLTPANLARAAVEGAALGIGYAISRLRDLGFDPPEIRLLGPGASNRVMRQLLADVLGAPVIPVSSEQGAAVGAAMQAAVAFFHHSGESLGFHEMAGYLVVGDGSLRCEPNLSLHPIYQELMARQQYLVDTLHPAGFL
jgi:xylulokinase